MKSRRNAANAAALEIGMEIGIDIVKNNSTKEHNAVSVENMVQEAFKRSLHIGFDHHSNIQFVAPLKNRWRGVNKLIARCFY